MLLFDNLIRESLSSSHIHSCSVYKLVLLYSEIVSGKYICLLPVLLQTELEDKKVLISILIESVKTSR